MASGVLSSLVCVLCVLLLPAVWGEYCSQYRDVNGQYYEAQQCYNQYCCGTCERKYCCSNRMYYFSQDKQAHCSGSGYGNKKQSKLATLLGSILGSILPVLLCVGLVICCVAPCCLFYKKCRKGNQRNSSMRNTPNVINIPQQPHDPGYNPDFPGYQPVPVRPGFGGPAPPPYGDNNPGHPMYPMPGQPYGPHPGGYSQPAYNPSYASNP